FQQPYAAKLSKACQSLGRSRPTRDWVMVCSSTLRTRPVSHSRKRCQPGVVKAPAQASNSACQWDQSWVASIEHLLGKRVVKWVSADNIVPGGAAGKPAAKPPQTF